MRKLILFISLMCLLGCGGYDAKYANLPPVNVTQPDGSIIRSRVIINVDTSEPTFATIIKKAYGFLVAPIAYAFTGVNPTASVTITYTNAENVDFVVDVSSLGIGITETNGVLDLGSFEIVDLDDNKLKVCSSPTKCQEAAIRVYTVGASSGFINNTDGDHSAPVYITGLNPNTSLGLTSTNALDITENAIAFNDNRLTVDELSQTLFDLSADMNNAGAGDYEMDLVIEYVLRNP